MPYQIRYDGNICITRFSGEIGELDIQSANAERLANDTSPRIHRFLFDCLDATKYTAPFSLHRRTAAETVAHWANSTERLPVIAFVIDAATLPALFGDVRAWQLMVDGAGITSKIFESVTDATAWLASIDNGGAHKS